MVGSMAASRRGVKVLLNSARIRPCTGGLVNIIEVSKVLSRTLSCQFGKPFL